MELEDTNRSLTFLELKVKVDKFGSLEYEHHVKPTSSGKYLNFHSHCPMAMKYDIFKMEATRVISNCSNIKDMYPHLNNLRNHFIKSDYPLTFINDIFIPLIKNRELGKDLMENRSKQVNNDDKEFIIRLPFINEAFTRIAKNNIKKPHLTLFPYYRERKNGGRFLGQSQ